MIKIKATPKFMQLANKFMTTERLQKLVDWLVVNPSIGNIIVGAAGIRKIRWQTGKDNKGKSGGIRILYYYDRNATVILLITLYRKADQENIDEDEKITLKKILPELLKRYVYE